ncbi:MAG: hypothetical protein M3409_09720 [Gemmatimonadota bacterium]|nr:hypothetical protein [Gemmatimonadota bacterium]
MKPDGASPAAVMEALEFRFGAFLAIAHAALQLAETEANPEPCLTPEAPRPCRRARPGGVSLCAVFLRRLGEPVGECAQGGTAATESIGQLSKAVRFGSACTLHPGP